MAGLAKHTTKTGGSNHGDQMSVLRSTDRSNQPPLSHMTAPALFPCCRRERVCTYGPTSIAPSHVWILAHQRARRVTRPPAWPCRELPASCAAHTRMQVGELGREGERRQRNKALVSSSSVLFRSDNMGPPGCSHFPKCLSHSSSKHPLHRPGCRISTIHAVVTSVGEVRVGCCVSSA